MAPVGFPNSADRTIVIGTSGSGKTQFAVGAILAKQNWNRQPWVIIDYKQEDVLLNSIVDEHRIPEIGATEKPPKRPGLYVMYPTPLKDDEDVDAWLWKVYAQGKIGLYVDEGFMIPQHRKSAFSAVLTQGRAKHIPAIVLYQRPVNMNNYTIGNASYFAAFPVTHPMDKKRLYELVYGAKTPDGKIITPFSDLPDYHCLWHDVRKRKTVLLRPAPSQDEILAEFRARIGNKGAII